MASFMYHHDAAPLPRFETQRPDLGAVKSTADSYDDTFAILGSPEAALLSSPVHLDFTGPLVDWNVSSLPIDQIHPPIMRPASMHSPEHAFLPARPVIATGVPSLPTLPPSPENNGLEIIHEWQELRLQGQQRPHQPLIHVPVLPSTHQIHDLAAPVIKPEDESTSPYSSDHSGGEPFVFASPIVPGFPEFSQQSHMHRPMSRRPPSSVSQQQRHSTGASRAKRPRLDAPPPTPTWTANVAPELCYDDNTVDRAGMEGSTEGFAAKVLSKRIAHKLSEKSRRNRLTTAIREIEKLLPAEMLAEFREPKKDAVDLPENLRIARPATLPISKVDVAEMALEYIRSLRKELKEARRRISKAEANGNVAKKKDA